MHDEVLTDGDSREQAAIAQLEAGLIPGAVIGRPEDLQAIDPDNVPSIVMLRIERQTALGGAKAGAAFGRFLRCLPPELHGKVLLMFDGWAGDRRELHEIDIVVRFCRGLLLGPVAVSPNALPDQDHAKEVLEVLLDEDAHAFEGEELKEPIWLDAAGAVWLCSHAFPGEIFSKGRKPGDPNVLRTAGKPSGWVRDYALALQIREWLAGRGDAPSR